MVLECLSNFDCELLQLLTGSKIEIEDSVKAKFSKFEPDNH